MKVVMLLDNPLRSDARVEKEAQVLTNNGHEVYIYAVTDASLPAADKTPFGIIYRTISPSIDHPLSAEYKQFKKQFTAEIAKREFDILHCHDYKMLLLGAEIKALKPNIKLVYDAHEFLHGWPFYKEIKGRLNQLKGKIIWKWFVKKEKTAIKSADAIITVSHSIAEEMQKVFGLKQKPVVLRNIPETAPLMDEKYFHKKYNLPAEAKVIVHSGNLYHSEKRIKMMIDTVASIENAYLLFIGNSAKLKELESKNTHPKVLFHDFIARLELYRCLSAADFGIVHTWQPDWPSHWLSLPNRIMEYSLAGIPIIATKQPEFLKIGAEFKHTVFYAGDSAAELKNAIHQGISEFDTLRSNALETRKKLSWENESLQLLTLYKQFSS